MSKMTSQHNSHTKGGRWLAGCITTAAVVTLGGGADAAINGFNNLSGWHVNVADSGAIDVPNSNTVQITIGQQRRSIFYNTPQAICALSVIAWPDVQPATQDSNEPSEDSVAILYEIDGEVRSPFAELPNLY